MSSASVALLVLAGSLATVAQQAEYPGDPLAATFVYTDVRRFWAAFDQLESRAPGENPFRAYVAEGSAGLKGFVANQRIVSADALLEMVLKERAYYERVRPSTLAARRYEAQVRATYAALKYWYPPAVFPPVYYVVGRLTSGGTASDAGLIIGIETFAEDEFATSSGRPTAPLDDLPFIVAHELIHFLQPPSSESPTLLEKALREGCADFIGELIAGERVRHLNGPDLYAYGDAHEAELWLEFRARMHATDLSGWLYSAAPEGRPQNLGYWMGHRIARAYFERQPDKKEAVAGIIMMGDARIFLERSGYGRKG